MKAVVSVFIWALVVAHASDERCYDNPSSSESNPLEKYMKNSNLVTEFLAKFPSPSKTTLRPTLIEESQSDNAVNNMVSWELAFFAPGLVGNPPKDVCRYTRIPSLFVDFEKTGDIATLKCALDLMRVNTQEIIYDMIEKVFDQNGCGEDFVKHVTQVPECIRSNCHNDENDSSQWEEFYEIIKAYAQEFNIPWNDNYHEAVSTFLSSVELDRVAMGNAILGVWVHTVYLAKKGLSADPAVSDVVLNMVNLMERVIHEKECSCPNRVDTLTRAAIKTDKAVKYEFDLLFSKFA